LWPRGFPADTVSEVSAEFGPHTADINASADTNA
jgi:hypothetical protein